MKTLIIALVTAASLFAQTYNAAKRNRVQYMPENPSVLLLDVTLDTLDVGYSDPFDIRKVAFSYQSDGTFDKLMGDLVYYCYDAGGTSTDSISVDMIIEASNFAADNTDPSKANSDTWYSVDSTLVQAVGSVEAASAAFTLAAGEYAQFIRLRAKSKTNDNAADVSRCAAYLHRSKPIGVE
jgi:hypothetical protein